MPTFDELEAAAEASGHPEFFVGAVTCARMLQRHDRDLRRIVADVAALTDRSPTTASEIFIAWLTGEQKRHEAAVKATLRALGAFVEQGCPESIIDAAADWCVEHPGWIEVSPEGEEEDVE